MSERNKELVRRTYELFNRGDLDGAAECWSQDFVMHVPYLPGDPNQFSGRENLKRLFQQLRSAFHNIHYTIDDMVAEGDKVAFRLTMRGIFTGEFLGMSRPAKRSSQLERPSTELPTAGSSRTGASRSSRSARGDHMD